MGFCCTVENECLYNKPSFITIARWLLVRKLSMVVEICVYHRSQIGHQFPQRHNTKFIGSANNFPHIGHKDMTWEGADSAFAAFIWTVWCNMASVWLFGTASYITTNYGYGMAMCKQPPHIVSVSKSLSPMNMNMDQWKSGHISWASVYSLHIEGFHTTFQFGFWMWLRVFMASSFYFNQWLPSSIFVTFKGGFHIWLRMIALRYNFYILLRVKHALHIYSTNGFC